jgi:hypothetical protein
MTTDAPQLHPLIPAGEFDLTTLLEYEPPTRWRPEPGEKVVGELDRIVEKTSFGHAAPTIYLLVPAEDGAEVRYLTVRASGVVLRGAVGELNPAPGERIAIKFEGMRESGEGRKYAMYRMAVKRASGWVEAR